MNAAVNHIMQTTDWNKYSLEEWLYQLGHGCIQTLEHVVRA